MSLTSFGSTAVKSFLTNEEMEAWKCIAIGMMSEEETTDDGKIERRRPSWRSEEYTIGWMSWIDWEQTHGKWPGKKGLMDLFSSTGPGWFASLDGEILAANTETLIWWHLRSCAHALYLHVPAYTI